MIELGAIERHVAIHQSVGMLWLPRKFNESKYRDATTCFYAFSDIRKSLEFLMEIMYVRRRKRSLKNYLAGVLVGLLFTLIETYREV